MRGNALASPCVTLQALALSRDSESGLGKSANELSP